MVTARSNFGIEVIDDRLFAVGGFNGLTTTYDVECYDAASDQWTEVCEMGVYRSALSCCVVSGFPSLPDYAAPRDELVLLHNVVEDDDDDGESLASV